MRKSKDNIGNSLQITTKMAMRTWQHRNDITIPIINKTFKNKGKIPAIVQEVIDNLWRNEELKPLIESKEYKEKDNKYIFIINLPAGVVSYKDFKSKENYFYDAIGGQVLIERRGKTVILTVLEGKLKTKYPYIFDPLLYNNMFLPFPVGHSISGLIVRDLAKFPYLLIGGLPDYGKSNLIHVINTSLLIGRPNTCFIVTIDFKRSEYATYMRNYGLLITKEAEAYNVLCLLEKELERRMDFCEKMGKQKIHNMPPNIRPPWIVVEIDEITELQHKESQLTLNRLVRLGRAYGFVIIMATQRPSAKTFRNETFTETRALCDARMCYHVREINDSIMILENPKGVDVLPVPGRGLFVYKDEEIELQTMYIDPEEIPSILEDVDHVYDDETIEGEWGYAEDSKHRQQSYSSTQFRCDIQKFNKPPKMLPPR